MIGRPRIMSLSRRITVAAVTASFVGVFNVGPSSGNAATSPVGPSDWPTYGHDAQHTFAGVTSLNTTSAHTLAQAWFFPTGDAVTADPIVVGNSVYVGSWDGYFYALDRATGTLHWKYQLKQQPAINPSPGNTNPRDVMSDGGLVTDAAWYQPAGGGRPNLVIFGGGYTLYALNADTGSLYWSHDYTGLPGTSSPTTDATRIFSSPIVFGNDVIFGVSSDGASGHRGYVEAANLNNGNEVWRFETDVNTSGQIQNDGCGGVWSSPSLDPVRRLVFVGVSDCGSQGQPPYGERLIALNTRDGSLAWVWTPPRLVGVQPGTDPACDFDFGASVNLGSPDPVTQAPTFLGVGGKDGTYYRINPATGTTEWATNVVFGGPAGGFIGTTAYDGTHVFGATALGDVGSTPCDASNPGDVPLQEPSIDAFNADGTIAWQEQQAQSFGPTTVAGGMTFSGNALSPEVQIRDAGTGSLLVTLATASDCFCGISVSANAVFFGTGSPQQGVGDGVYAYTPLGAPPTG